MNFSPLRFTAVLIICLLWLLTAARAALPLAEKIILVPHTGATVEDAGIVRWQVRARAVGASAADFEQLGWAYVAKARRTLDAGYWKLAEKTAEAMDARFGVSAESRLLRGHVLHNLHRFRDAEAVARQLVLERGAPMDFALLSDALMEQGKLTDAVAACQQFVNLRPGLEAYARIAQLRWLKGDLAGATAAMEQAARASAPRDSEASAWALTRLSGFYLLGGRTDAALTAAESAAQRAPDFAPALLAVGRALAAAEPGEGVLALRRAATLNPLPEYQWWLADALRAIGRGEEAVQVEAQLKAGGETADPRTLALFLATRREDAPRALLLAREELANRADVLTHDALAWALAASGDLAAAHTEMEAALAERTTDARLFWHAGEIAFARGEHAAADKFFAAARPLASALTPSERRRLAGHNFTGASAPSRQPNQNNPQL